jgi:hypothetical protein
MVSPENDLISPLRVRGHDNLSLSVLVIDVDAKPVIAFAARKYAEADESIGTREYEASCLP